MFSASPHRISPGVDQQKVPYVSVIVPTWNRADLLKATIGSLLNQAYPSSRYELIIVDDGSSDSTSRIVKDLQSVVQAPVIRYSSQPHRGPNAARNAGLSLASGQLICFVDDDVEAPPGWLRAITHGSWRFPAAECFGGPIRLRLEGQAPRLCGREPLGETELDLGPVDKLVHPRLGDPSVEAVWSANMAIRREAVERAGPFDEALSIYGDELEWEVRLHERGGAIAYLHDAWLWHRRTAQDLRLARLLRSRFRRGKNIAINRCLHVGQGPAIRKEIEVAGRMLYHALRRQCSLGLLGLAAHLGVAYGLLKVRAGRA